MFRRKDPPAQPPLWIATSDLPASPVNTFYRQLDRALQKNHFGDDVRALCAPYYEMDATKGGQPGVDPEVYFKMLMIGFFENLASERGIAARCADSFSIRDFLHYALTEPTPDHSTLHVIRQRLPHPVYEQVFGLVLKALKRHKLLRGNRLAIDSSVLEANASLRALQHRCTGEVYADYVKGLAAEAGVDPADATAVRRFDKKRKKKTSNKDWQNPHDPDAKVGRTKRGATRMIYKPEHVVDLDTGAIVDAGVRLGDADDRAGLAERVLDAEAKLQRAVEEPVGPTQIEMLAADKGYYEADQITALHSVPIATAISDPIDNRRMDKLSATEQVAVEAAKRTVQSPAGKALLRRRGELLERTFAQVLDCGGARRTTLRGWLDIEKRYLIQAACANLSLLMRTLVRYGTPKQALALA